MTHVYTFLHMICAVHIDLVLCTHDVLYTLFLTCAL